jgi:hypothetical protein
MDEKNFKIVVSGDICINLMQWVTHPEGSSGFNWQDHLNMHSRFKPGAALLLAKFVAMSTGAELASPHMQEIGLTLPREYLLSATELELFPAHYGKRNTGRKVYRISRFIGFTGPESIAPKLLPIDDDDADADMVVLDDENNGFNSDPEFWPAAIREPGKSPIVLCKLDNPMGSSELWNHLQKFHNDKTIVVITADDIRSKGVNISKSLSWERTAQDFVWHINNNPNLAFLASCRHLIVPFGVEGAIYCNNESTTESRLYFIPYESEGGFMRDDQGRMYGLTSCFVAGLARAIVQGSQNGDDIVESIDNGIRQGIVSAQKYFVAGFGDSVEGRKFPDPSIFARGDDDFVLREHVQDVVVPNSSSSSDDCRLCWYILKEKSSANLADIAYDIVKNGITNALKSIPIAKFGQLMTVDKAEIESYRSIKNLMLEYLSTKKTSRPLSISVFGTPGSGKSFGIVEVASSIAPDLIKKLDFNLSQLSTPNELASAFHKVRDISLEGKVPLVFFDEFDSAYGGNLGWLKYFLAPMQDGVFREGDSTHPIGKAIFVFAGGTSSTFEEFCGEDVSDEGERKKFLLEFKSAKGPDFVSRLRGYVNILGPNQTDEHYDQLFIIRRAMLLRALLKRKVPHLINDKREAQIDNGVIRALLKISRYKHESRSMEAILEMSMLNDAKKWEQSDLPSKEQLRLHVDEEQFLRHLMHDAFFSEKVESLAIAIHENHRMLHNADLHGGEDVMGAWEDISEAFKDINRSHAKDIPAALLKINYDIVAVKEKPLAISFTDKELDILSAHEHMRWYSDRKQSGWRYGDTKDYTEKTDPSLVPWESLPNEKKQKLIKVIKAWPKMLASSNFKLERLKFMCYCEGDIADKG